MEKNVLNAWMNIIYHQISFNVKLNVFIRNLMLMVTINAKIHKLYIVQHVILMDRCVLHAKKIHILNKTDWNA